MRYFEEVNRLGRIRTRWSTGFVYVAGFADAIEPTKIGWSENPWVRIEALGHCFGRRLRLLGIVEVARSSPLWGVRSGSLEAQIHRHLESERCDPVTLAPTARGEWYSYGVDRTEEILAFIGKIARAFTGQSHPVRIFVGPPRSMDAELAI